MPDTSSLKEARDAQLDALKEAFEKYIDDEIARQENMVTLLEGILEGHNTPTSVNKTVIDEITVLSELELSKYLAGQ